MNQPALTLLRTLPQIDTSVTQEKVEEIIRALTNPTQEEDYSLVTIKDAAKLMHLSRVTIWRLCESGTLKSVKIGGKARRIYKRSIMRFIQTGCDNIPCSAE